MRLCRRRSGRVIERATARPVIDPSSRPIAAPKIRMLRTSAPIRSAFRVSVSFRKRAPSIMRRVLASISREDAALLVQAVERGGEAVSPLVERVDHLRLDERRDRHRGHRLAERQALVVDARDRGGVAAGERRGGAVGKFQRLDGDVLRRPLGLGRLDRIGQQLRHLVLQRPLLGRVDLDQPLDPIRQRAARRLAARSARRWPRRMAERCSPRSRARRFVSSAERIGRVRRGSAPRSAAWTRFASARARS